MPLASSPGVAVSRVLASTPVSGGLRRRAARLEVPRGLVRAEIPGLNLTADVRDVSTGGFSIETFRPFAQGATHQFKLKTSSGWSGVARAKAAHCRWLNDPDGSVRFISGWQFLFDTDLAAEPTNERLVEAVASLLGVDPAAPIDETND
jgi:hypothetical protein